MPRIKVTGYVNVDSLKDDVEGEVIEDGDLSGEAVEVIETFSVDDLEDLSIDYLEND
jgi:hypothetical protein